MTPNDLRRRRAALGLSHAQLARRLGVNRATVWRWEHDMRAIPALLERAIRDLEREHDAESRPAAR